MATLLGGITPNPSPGPITPRRLQDPNKNPGGGYDVRGCKEDCARKYPMYYKDALQKEDYDACIAECEKTGDVVNPPPAGEDGTTTECPEGKGKTYEGCSCGEAYGTKTGKCAPGYFFVKREAWEGKKDGVSYSEGLIGTCHCQKAVDDWKAKEKAGGKGGEFEWSPEVQALLQRILDRANMLLDQPLGLSDEERQAIYNRIYEKIKGTERPAIQSQMDVISRQGMLGTPYAERSITGIQRGTREMLGGAERDVELEEAQRRYDQLMGTTGMVQSLFGSGMGAEQMAEALSAGRRGEGQNWMQMLLNYFATIYGGQDNSYWQAIMNRLLNPGT